MLAPMDTPTRLPFARLGAWYADPLSPQRAEQLCRDADARQAARTRRVLPCLSCRLLRLVAHFWLGREVEQEYALLLGYARRDRRMWVLTELVYGQLLMSRRATGAMQHLDRAFTVGRRLFAPDDYFAVLKRHQALRRLPLGAPQPPLALAGLLTTAAVIERLERANPPPRRFSYDPNDTYG